jgi:hypothetical protein
MSMATIILHEGLIRSAKGLIAAWDKWLQSQKNKSAK